jgi:hypothetical protein
VYYISRLTDEHSSVNGEYIGLYIYRPSFGCLSGWVASKTGVTYNNNRMTTQSFDIEIYNNP